MTSSNPITTQKIDNRKLKSYGLKIGSYIHTNNDEGLCVGMVVIESNVNTFELNKGEKRHMIQVQIDDDTVIGQDIFETDFFYNATEKVQNQIRKDRKYRD